MQDHFNWILEDEKYLWMHTLSFTISRQTSWKERSQLSSLKKEDKTLEVLQETSSSIYPERCSTRDILCSSILITDQAICQTPNLMFSQTTSVISSSSEESLEKLYLKDAI